MSYDYNLRMKAARAMEKERRLQRTAEFIDRHFESDLSYVKVEAVEPDGTFSEKNFKVIHGDYITHLNPDRMDSVYFVGHPGEVILAGTFLLNYLNSDWMVTASSNLVDLLYRGMIQRVNFPSFKWVVNGQLFSSRAIASGVSRRSDGIDEKRVMVLPEEAVAISVPDNIITRTLERDIRFILDRTPYRITKIVSYESPNLLNIVAIEDFSGKNDNFELGIADYDKITTIFEPEKTGFSINIIGQDVIRSGKNLSLVAQVFENGHEISSNVIWSIENLDGTNNKYINYQIDGNIISLIANPKFDYIGQKILIKANYELAWIEKIITIIGVV